MFRKILLFGIFLILLNEISAQFHYLKLDSLTRAISKKQVKKGNITSENILLIHGIFSYKNEKIDTLLNAQIFTFDSLMYISTLDTRHQLFLKENENIFFALVRLNLFSSEQNLIALFSKSFENYSMYPRALLKNKINYELPRADLLDIFILNKDELENTTVLKFKGKNFLNKVAYQLFLEFN